MMKDNLSAIGARDAARGLFQAEKIDRLNRKRNFHKDVDVPAWQHKNANGKRKGRGK